MGRPGQKAKRLQDAARHSQAFVRHALKDGMMPDAGTPEEAYSQAAPLDHRKRFGQFFTPPAIAAAMADWVLADGRKTLLDPACGTGLFIRLALERSGKLEAKGVDLDAAILSYAQSSLGNRHGVSLQNGDALLELNGDKYDAVLLNPPYLKHHDFSYDFDLAAHYSAKAGVPFSRLGNLYVYFIVEACLRLEKNGRAAVIVPIEWANSNFGGPLKKFLIDRGFLKEVAYFDGSLSVFSDALTTACVLKLENSRPATSVKIVQRNGSEHFRHEVAPAVLRNAKKWETLLRQNTAEAPAGFVALSKLATTRRGIATGANDFFCISQQKAQELGIRPQHQVPCVMRALDAPGLVFGKKDYADLAASERKSVLLAFSRDISVAEKKYLRQGEEMGLPQRFLLAQRRPWYAMEPQTHAAIWAGVFGRRGLRFVLNQAGVCNLTAFHGITPRLKEPVFAKALCAALNSGTVQKLARNILRVYGGGLMKVEPRDLLDLQVPDLSRAPDVLLEELAGMLPELDRAERAAQDMSGLQKHLEELVLEAAKAASKTRQQNTGQFCLL